MGVFFLLCGATSQIAKAEEDKFPGFNDRQSIAQEAANTGEIFDALRGELSYETVDAVIPGDNGMDIVISRSYGRSEGVWGFKSQYSFMLNWHLEIPRVIIPTNAWGVTRGWQPSRYDEIIRRVSSTRTGICNDPYPGVGFGYPNDFHAIYEDGIAERFWSGMKLKIPGQPAQYLIKNTDTSGRYPSDAKWVTTSDWIASCTDDGSGFVVKSPKGVTYTLDILDANYAPRIIEGWEGGHNTLLASQVEDLHGNTINYTYDSGGEFAIRKKRNGANISNFELPIFYNKLTQITRNDKSGEQIVQFNYATEENDRQKQGALAEIIFNGRKLTYKYDPEYLSYLDEVIRPDGSSWKYKYEGGQSYRNENPKYEPSYNGPQLLTQVTLPSGGVVDYRYKEFNKLPHDSYDKDWRLHTKTINDGSTDIDHWVFDYRNNIGSTVKVVIERGLDSDIQVYKNDKSYQHGRLISQTLQRRNSAGVVIESKKTEYTYAEIAQIGDFQFEDYPKEIPDSLTSKVKLTQKKITQEGSIYITDYLMHDKYGRPTKIRENNSGKYRFTKLEYHDEFDNWLMGSPSKTEVSDRDSNYLTQSEIIYHDSSTSSGAYEGLGLPYEQREFGRWVKRFTEYSSEGNLQRIEYNAPRTVGAGNRFVEYADYKRGIPQTVTLPSPESSGSMNQTQVVDNNGLIKSKTDFNNVTTKYRHDKLGRISSVDLAKDTNKNINWKDYRITWGTNSDGEITRKTKRCTLNDSGSLCTGPFGFETVETFDGLFRLKKIFESDALIKRYKNFSYNRYNQKTFESNWSDIDDENNPYGTYYSFDGLRRLKSKRVSGLGTINYEYQSGNRIKVTDAERNVTTTTYRAYGEPVYNQAIRVDSPENVTTTIDINELGLIEEITQSGFQKDGIRAASQTETRVYDTYKQLCLIKRKDVGNKLFNKNALGETNWVAEGVPNNACTTSKPSSTAITYTFDNAGKVKGIDYPDIESPDVTYERDNNGNLKTLTAGIVTHRYEYNNQNLLTEEILSIGNEKTLKVGYGYTSMMHPNYVEYPDGSTIYSKPNVYGNPTSVKEYKNNEVEEEFASDVLHYVSGQLDSFTYGNGITHKTTIDPISLLPSDIEDFNGSHALVDLSYTYDNNSNIESIIDTQNPSYSLTHLGYDGLNRLISTTGATNSSIGSSVINYDSLGNITYFSSKDSVLDYTYNYANNRLLNVSGTGSKSKNYSYFNYDNRGNITHNSHDSLDFNRANQLFKSGVNTYLYDGFNRRVKQTDNKGTSYSLYSQQGTLLYRETDVVNGKGNGINYIYLGKKLIAKVAYEEPQSSTRQHYKPYGATLSAAKDDIGYTGHKFDTDLELSYMQARYYDPVIGRFYSNDPVGYTAANPVMSFNRYMYANNNPYKYKDPDGEFPVLGFIAGVALEVTRQALTGEIKDTSLSGIAKNVGKALVSGAVGATGAGLASKAASLSLAGRTAANTASGAALGASSTVANNAIDGKGLTDNLAQGTAFGAAGGLVGSAGGDAVDAVSSAIKTAVKGNGSFATKQMAAHINDATGQTLGVSVKSSSVGVGDVVGNTLGNSSGIADCKSNGGC